MVNKFYGSANSEAELVTNLYGSGYILSSFSATVPQADSQGSDMEVTAVDSAIITPLVNSNAQARGFMDSGWSSGGKIVLFIVNLRYITIQLATAEGSTYLVYQQDTPSWGQIKAILRDDYGITLTGNFTTVANYVKVTIPISPTIIQNAQRIAKLYGSVNNATKLIYQEGFGHAEYYRYGRMVYYTDSSHTTTKTISLESQSDIDGLCAQSVWDTTWNASVQGISIPNTDIKEVYLTSLVSSIPNNFLYRCTSLDNLDFSQTTITTTNPYFVNGCSSLNVPITIPQTLTTMLGGFLSNNASFNQPITLPSGLVSIGYNFFTGNDSMTSPINVGSLSESIILEDTYSSYSFNVNSPSAAYTNGIPIAGSNRAAWIARFPNLSGPWYRKLIDAGY